MKTGRNTSRLSGVGLALAGILALGVAGQASAADRPTRLDMQGAYPGAVHLLGTSPSSMTKRLETATDGKVRIRWHEPNSIVPPQEVFDAVSTGALDAFWGTPGDASNKDIAFTLFTSVPFGPTSLEFISWVRHGGGQELMDELYGRYNIVAMPCGVVASEASGWFRKEIKSTDDLDGLKMRFFGLGGLVMEKFGVSTQSLPAGEIFQALQLGTIDATEFSTPSMDINLGFYQVAKHYYFPGWHQPTAMDVLAINKDVWDKMPDGHKVAVRMACDSVINEMLFEGEASQGAALAKMQAAGAQIHSWSPEVLGKFRAAWKDVEAEVGAGNDLFQRTRQSLEAYRKEYKLWRDLSSLSE